MRKVIFPFKRGALERSSNSIIMPGAYMFGGTTLDGRNYVGKRTVLKNVHMGYGSYVNNDCLLTNTEIGKYVSIGTCLKSVIGRHPISECVAMHPAFYSSAGQMGYTYTDKDYFEETVWLDKDAAIQIRIGNDVWIGNDVKIMEGVTIGDGAVVAAGSIVTRDVAPYSVFGGIPAKFIRMRFTDEQINSLEKIQWWDMDESWIRHHIEEFNDPEAFCRMAEEGISADIGDTDIEEDSVADSADECEEGEWEEL